MSLLTGSVNTSAACAYYITQTLNEVTGMCRGQKHQRREKQAQHLDNSEELSHSAVAAVLSDGECPSREAQPAEHATHASASMPEEAGELIMKLPLSYL